MKRQLVCAYSCIKSTFKVQKIYYTKILKPVSRNHNNRIVENRRQRHDYNSNLRCCRFYPFALCNVRSSTNFLLKWSFRSRRRRLSAFHQRSLPFLTFNATIGNKAFSHHRCRNNKYANNTCLNSPRKNDAESQVEFIYKGYGKG